MNTDTYTGFDDVVASNPPLGELVDAYFATKFTMENGQAVVDPYVLNGVKEAQAYLDEIVGLSKEEAAKRALAYNQTIKSTRMPESINKTVVDLKAKVGNIIISIEENENPIEAEEGASPSWIVDEALWLLDSLLIELDCCADFPDLEILSPLTTKEWHSKEIEAATENLQNKIKFYQIACQKVEETNAALRIIRSYLD